MFQNFFGIIGDYCGEEYVIVFLFSFFQFIYSRGFVFIRVINYLLNFINELFVDCIQLIFRVSLFGLVFDVVIVFIIIEVGILENDNIIIILIV